MSGAGETRNSRLEAVERERAGMYPSAETAVRHYSRNGVTWTVHRTGGAKPVKGWRATWTRVTGRMRSARRSFRNLMMKQWP